MALPQLLFFNESGYNAEVATLTQRTATYQQVVAAFLACNTPIALVSADVYDLVYSPHALLWRKLNNGTTPSLNGIPVNPEKAWQLVDWPAEALAYFAQAKAAQDGTRYTLTDVWEITGGGATISLKSAFLGVLQEQYKTYARTQKQLDHWTVFSGFAAGLNTLRTTYYNGSNIEWAAMIHKFLEHPDAHPANVHKVNPGPISQIT